MNPNPFIIETALIAHLSAEIPELAGVGSFAKYQSWLSVSDVPPLPCAVVMPDDSEVTDDGPEAFQVENQLWMISIFVGHSPDENDVDTTAIRAGALMAKINGALVGWRPEYQGSRLEGFKPMRYAGRAVPIYAPGFGEFPVLFETGLVLTGN